MLKLYQMNETSQILLKRYGAEKIIAQLEPFVSRRRQQRISEVLDNRLLSIQVALEMPADIHNAFAVIRSCEIFGIGRIHIIAAEKTISGMRPISKGAMDWVEIIFYKNIQDFLTGIREQNIRLAGAIPQASHSLDCIDLTGPVCFFLGNEHSGLSAEAQAACDWHYHIPMFGMTQSLNLSVAAAISLYESTQRKRHEMQKSGDLTASERKILQAQYFLNSVNARLMNALFYEGLRRPKDADHR
jgi:tRNA (guanosine-2'-O-)-methyltransferase